MTTSDDDAKMEHIIAAGENAEQLLGQHYTQTLARRKMEMGWIGKVFGGATEAPSNIAGTAVVVSFIVLMILFFVDLPAGAPRGEAIGLFGSIISLSIGFLFGQRGN